MTPWQWIWDRGAKATTSPTNSSSNKTRWSIASSLTPAMETSMIVPISVSCWVSKNSRAPRKLTALACAFRRRIQQRIHIRSSWAASERPQIITQAVAVFLTRAGDLNEVEATSLRIVSLTVLTSISTSAKSSNGATCHSRIRTRSNNKSVTRIITTSTWMTTCSTLRFKGRRAWQLKLIRSTSSWRTDLSRRKPRRTARRVILVKMYQLMALET